MTHRPLSPRMLVLALLAIACALLAGATRAQTPDRRADVREWQRAVEDVGLDRCDDESDEQPVRYFSCGLSWAPSDAPLCSALRLAGLMPGHAFLVDTDAPPQPRNAWGTFVFESQPTPEQAATGLYFADTIGWPVASACAAPECSATEEIWIRSACESDQKCQDKVQDVCQEVKECDAKDGDAEVNASGDMCIGDCECGGTVIWQCGTP